MNSRFLMSGILFLAFSLGATSFDELYQQGIGAIRKGDRVHALSLFEKASALAKGPEQRTNAILQRSLAMPREKEKEALQMLLNYRKKSGKLPLPSERVLELRIGVLQTRLKEYGKAVETLSYAVSLKGLSERDRSLAYDMLSNAQLHQKQYENALKTLDHWETLDSISANDYARLLTRRAGIYGSLKRFEEAYQTGYAVSDIAGVSAINQALAWQMLAHVAFVNEKNFEKAKSFSEKSRAVPNGKWGFNRVLHEKILKACGKGK